MKKSRFSEEQIAYALRLAKSGTPVVGEWAKAGAHILEGGRIKPTFAWRLPCK